MPEWESRFWEKVDVGEPDGCWLWLASKTPLYGAFHHSGKQWRAHRIAYELRVGPIPDGLQLHHTCGNAVCVNPRHLKPVTHAEHMAIGGNILKTHCPHGHLYTPDNLYVYDGKRSCRRCKITQATERNRRLASTRKR